MIQSKNIYSDTPRKRNESIKIYMHYVLASRKMSEQNFDSHM